MRQTRFQQEISGECDAWVKAHGGNLRDGYWKEHAQAEVAWVLNKYENGEMLIDKNGVATWVSNGRAIPQECVEKAIYGGLPINAELTKELEDRQTEQSLAEYRERMKNHVYSDEELFEMRAAFGAGAVVVDAITGRRIQL